MMIENSKSTAIEKAHKLVSSTTSKVKKSDLGQYLTSSATARFMAGMFEPTENINCCLLDPGAGIGRLSCAFFDRVELGELNIKNIKVDAVEIDVDLIEQLNENLGRYEFVEKNIINSDYINKSTGLERFGEKYTHVIMNPPYKKINGSSSHKRLLKNYGVESVNLYSAFLSLAIEQTLNDGQIVAIIPRSFCNGPYYKSFRELILSKTAIKQIHLFSSRNDVFKEDSVLQENVIIYLKKGADQGDVLITTSNDDSFLDFNSATHSFDSIVKPDDSNKFIHVPTSTARCKLDDISRFSFDLKDLGINVSTGPVVDFRLREHLLEMPAEGSAPLIYPSHFQNMRINWPNIYNKKKPNAILINESTERWLYPSGYYCVVKRFSSKEEKKRIVAYVVEPEKLDGSRLYGFENHLNVFHFSKSGLSRELAWGLAVYLNMSAVDEAFRRFNGHTQVNVTDLKLIKYPSIECLIGLGEWAIQQNSISTESIDLQFEKLAA